MFTALKTGEQCIPAHCSRFRTRGTILFKFNSTLIQARLEFESNFSDTAASNARLYASARGRETRAVRVLAIRGPRNFSYPENYPSVNDFRKARCCGKAVVVAFRQSGLIWGSRVGNPAK